MGNRLSNRNNRDIWQLIKLFDQQRNQQILLQKYAKMRKNAFAFFRGACHLFYQDLPRDSVFTSAPVVWICGDLHLENFGGYKGKDRQIYFGINDFDESILAPYTWDIARLVTSIWLAVDSLSFDRSDGQDLAQAYLTSYINTITAGRVGTITQDNSTGIVANLLKDLDRRKRSQLLDQRTTLTQDIRQLKFDNEKILKISNGQQARVTKTIEDWAKSQADPDFFRVLDVGFRIAGTGSLGLDRYLILVVGKGSPDRNYLLDVKQQSISSLQPYVTTAQPEWTNSATRAMQIQSLVQSTPPDLLAAIEFDNSSYLLRELQPTQDKIALKAGKISLSQLKQLIHIMAEVTAFAHLHSSGKFGADSAQALINFSTNLDWQQELLIYTRKYSEQVQLDYQNFCKATQDL